MFNCMNCDKSWSNCETARRKAYKHAKKTGHYVFGKVINDYKWNFKKL